MLTCQNGSADLSPANLPCPEVNLSFDHHPLLARRSSWRLIVLASTSRMRMRIIRIKLSKRRPRHCSSKPCIHSGARSQCQHQRCRPVATAPAALIRPRRTAANIRIQLHLLAAMDPHARITRKSIDPSTRTQRQPLLLPPAFKRSRAAIATAKS